MTFNLLFFQIRIAERVLTFALCLFIYYPFLLFGIIAIYIRRLIFFLKVYTGLGYKEFGRLGHISRRHRVSRNFLIIHALVKQPSTTK